MAYSAESIVVVSAVLGVLTIVAVSARIWVRVKVLPSHLGADDWLAVVSCVFAVAYCVDLIIGATLGFAGQDWPDEIPDQRYIVGEKYMYVQVVIEKVLYATIKLSALCFFRRIFTTRHFKQFNDVMIAVVIVWAVVFFCLLTFQCGGHPEVLWTPRSSRPGCLDQTKLNLAYGVTDAVLDMLVIIMPFPCIRKLQIKTREKVGLTAIFLLGALATVASFLRLAFIAQAVPMDYSGGGNRHGAATPVDFWCMVEATVGTLAICLPPLAPLLRWNALRAKMTATSAAALSRKETNLSARPSLSQLEKGPADDRLGSLSDAPPRRQGGTLRKPSESCLTEEFMFR